MEITYIIGNGFDINLGLKTSYTDFYSYFKKYASVNNSILNWLNEDENNDKFDRWSDLEKVIGLKTELINDDFSKFEEDVIELYGLLKEYLLNQENYVNYQGLDDEIYKEINTSLSSFIDCGNSQQKSIIVNNIKEYPSDFYTYNFIDFNYTNILDNILSICNKHKKAISNHISSDIKYDDKLGELLHVHGTLKNGFIFGVNDAGQINNKKLAESDYKNCFIKSYLNSDLGDLNEQKGIQLINRSSLIITFGLSIGETDKNWWVRIIKWLAEDRRRVLIIHHYDKEMINNLNPILIGKTNRELFKRLEKICDFNVQSELRNRILFYYNKNDHTFNFKFLVKNENKSE